MRRVKPPTRFSVAMLLERAGLTPWTPENPEGWMVDDWHSRWQIRITTGQPARVISILESAGLVTKTIDNRTIWAGVPLKEVAK